MAIRKKCIHCGWPISTVTLKCPNCKLSTLQGPFVVAGLLVAFIRRPFLAIFIISILILIGTLGKDVSQKLEDINQRAERLLNVSGVQLDDTFCVEDFTRNPPSHPYINISNLDSNEREELSNVSKRNNPELYEEIENKYKEIFEDWISWRGAMKLNQKYLALLNCNSKDKRPQDLEDMKKLGSEMQKIIPETYIEFPNLKF